MGIFSQLIWSVGKLSFLPLYVCAQPTTLDTHVLDNMMIYCNTDIVVHHVIRHLSKIVMIFFCNSVSLKEIWQWRYIFFTKISPRHSCLFSVKFFFNVTLIADKKNLYIYTIYIYESKKVLWRDIFDISRSPLCYSIYRRYTLCQSSVDSVLRFRGNAGSGENLAVVS